MTRTKSVLLSILTALVFTGCHPATSKDKEKGSKGDGIAFPQSSDVLSKWVRVNVADYWTFARQDSLLAPYTSASGVVMGDAHLANFGVVPVEVVGQGPQMRYLDIDFDDAGRAPFALDFLRLVITSKATKSDVKIREMVDAYAKGLRGEAVSAPIELTPYLSMSLGDYRKKMDDDLDGKTNADGFRFKPGKIEPYKGTVARADLARLVPQISIVDVALRPEENGENAGKARIWIYGKDKSGLRRLFELKAYEPTALANFAPQLSTLPWSDEVHEAFWSGIARGEYEIATLANGETYWVREKKLTLIDIPYSSKDKSAILFVRHLAAYDSYILGTLHGRQASAAALRDRLANPVEQAAFLESVKEAAKIYLHDVATRTPLASVTAAAK